MEKEEVQKILKEKAIQKELSKKEKEEKNRVEKKKSNKNNKIIQTITPIKELEVLYKEGNLEILNKELKK